MMQASSNSTVGSMRYMADKRQLGALLMLTGFCALIQPLASVAGTIASNEDGTTPSSGIAFSGLIGGLFVTAVGVTSILAGYGEAVHDAGHKYIYFALLILTQTAYIPYITGMTGVGKAARFGPSFAMGDSSMTTAADNRFIGAMGILGIMAYGFGLIGSVAFMQFSLYAFQAGKPQDRNAAYYHGRARFYTAMLFLAGLSQFLLGVYVQAALPKEALPVGVAFYLVNLPAAAIVVGLIQLLNALYALARTCGYLVYGDSDNMLQISIALGWIVQVALQVLAQPGTLPGAFAANAPTVAAFSFAMQLMPAFLDYKARTVPMVMEPAYYGLEMPSTKEDPASDNKEDV